MTLRSVLVSTDNTFILSLLAVTVTLSLERPHISYMDARPRAHVGTKILKSRSSHPSQIQSCRKGKRKEGKKS